METIFTMNHIHLTSTSVRIIIKKNAFQRKFVTTNIPKVFLNM